MDWQPEQEALGKLALCLRDSGVTNNSVRKNAEQVLAFPIFFSVPFHSASCSPASTFQVQLERCHIWILTFHLSVTDA